MCLRPEIGEKDKTEKYPPLLSDREHEFEPNPEGKNLAKTSRKK